jgi:hypothetical protein
MNVAGDIMIYTIKEGMSIILSTINDTDLIDRNNIGAVFSAQKLENMTILVASFSLLLLYLLNEANYLYFFF